MTVDATTQDSPRVLYVARRAADIPAVAELLPDASEVRVVQGADEAVAALRTEPFDLVVSDASELMALARAASHRESENILGQLGLGVCMVNADGSSAWDNPKFQNFPPDAAEQIRRICVEECRAFTAEQVNANPQRSHRREVRVGDAQVYELTIAPLQFDGTTVTQVVALVADVSQPRRLQEKIAAIDEAGRELVRLDPEKLSRLDVSDRLALFEEKVIRFSHDLLQFDHLAVRVLDWKHNRLETVVATGFSEAARSLEILALPDDNGISGYVAATGRSYICRDIARDPRYLPGIDGARSSLTVPLRLNELIVGVFNVESERVDAFNDDDRQFAEIFARYMAIALHILQLLAVERYTTTGQVAADVDAEVAAPLNDIISDATVLLTGGAMDDASKAVLRRIIDNVDLAKRAIRNVTEPSGISGLIPVEESRDPVIDGKRILIAEDEDIIRDTVAEVLSKSGALTVTASDGNKALAMIAAQHFDLVLSDIKMPCKTGYEVFSAVKAVHEECPVILITGFGYDPEHSIVRASKEGLAGVLFKPFKVEQLLTQVRQALSNTPA